MTLDCCDEFIVGFHVTNCLYYKNSNTVKVHHEAKQNTDRESQPVMRFVCCFRNAFAMNYDIVTVGNTRSDQK